MKLDLLKKAFTDGVEFGFCRGIVHPGTPNSIVYETTFEQEWKKWLERNYKLKAQVKA